MLQLQIETIGGICNARCSFCLLQDRAYFKNQGVATGIMADGLYAKLLDEAATIPQISQLCLTGLSETLLDPKLVERVAYARKTLPSTPISIYTNGYALTERKFLALRDAGLSSVDISLNATTATEHDAVMHMGPDAFDRICKHIELAIFSRGPVVVRVKAVALPGFSIQDFSRRWGSHGICCQEGNWAGELQERTERRADETCGRAVSQFYVTWDGKHAMCCFDPLAKNAYGDLTKESIRRIYNREEYARFRQDHAEGKASRYDTCAHCTRI